jgi:hypothetical protein
MGSLAYQPPLGELRQQGRWRGNSHSSRSDRGVPAKVVSERFGHANIAITMDTYSHVLPGLDAQAADTVARLILGPPEPSSDPSADKPLTTGHSAADRGGR